MLALVLAALAPTLAQAVVASSDRSDWVQICSTTGMAWVKVDTAAADTESAPMADMGMQCPWCTLHSPATGLPPAPGLTVTAAAQISPVEGLTAALPPVGVWLAAPVRAPPLAS
jgi:hypothetical protein